MFVKNMLLAGEQVIILYLIAAVGFITDKAGLFTEKTAKKWNKDLQFREKRVYCLSLCC